MEANINTTETFDLIQMSDLEKRFPIKAKKLHEALKSETRFADWVRRRIQTFELIPDYDYSLELTSELGATEVVNDYFFSIETAKELAMVENNETGRKIRRYFIEMERKAKGIALHILPNSIAQESAAAAIVVESELKIGALLGAPQSLARVHAVTEVSKLFPRIDRRLLLVNNPEEKQELDLIPTEISKELGLKSAREANQLLAAKGYQFKNGEHWELTEKGKQFGSYHKTAKIHSNGTPIQQIKWKKDVLKALKD